MKIKKKTLNPLDVAKAVAALAEEKKAMDIVILDMRSVINFCDFFVICSGNTDRQVKAIADAVDIGMEALGVSLKHTQREKKPEWIVLDSGDVVVHVFQKQLREFYNLEYLWREAERVT